MADAELGQKRACPSCSRKFYDLMKLPAVCPYCGAAFNPDDPGRGRSRKVAPPEEERKKPADKPASAAGTPEERESLTENLDDNDGDEDDDVLEDASDLGEDDSDLDEVMEHVEKPEKEG